MKTIIRFLKNRPQLFGLTLLILNVGFTSCKKEDSTETSKTISYSGSFIKSGDAVVSSASGTATATFDPTTLVLTYTISWSGLTSNAANMHFHDAGPVIYPITGFATATTGTLTGSVTLTATQATDLAAGKIYVQIHTGNIPAGEILATLSQSSSTYTPTGGGY
jgi:hypothetical protein